jgi:hypothetical protein
MISAYILPTKHFGLYKYVFNVRKKFYAFKLSKWQNSTSCRSRTLSSKFSSYNYSSISRLYESTQSEFSETCIMKISLSGELIMNGADNKCKMVSEVEEGNASVEEW